ncbi:MAG: hypothetical protein OEQ28_05005 [Acidobacteriota bacterium]|nr:hypothetical protein [Acidobacteriota bacterium]
MRSQIPRGTVTNPNNFQKLLVWLSDSVEESGEAYEALRQRLIRIFYARGCQTAEELADETIDRVTAKIESLIDTYEGDPRLYFYGVAKNVFREHLRKPVHNELPVNLSPNSNHSTEKAEYQDLCLTKCLKKLPEMESEFILDYYKGEKSQKIENRQKLMEKLDLTPQALRVKAFRVRAKLQKCVFACLEMKTA